MEKQVKTAFGGVLLAVALLLVAPVFTNAQRPDGAGPGMGAARAHEGHHHSEEAKQEAKARAEAIRAEVKERRAEIKANVCERREVALQRAMPNLANGAENVKSSFDTVYERVQGFYGDGQLTVENYDTLVANVDAAQVDATAALEVIETFSFELDCENPNVGEQLASYRDSIRGAREALVTYREELVALISAMRAEAATQHDANSGEENPEGVRSDEGASDA